MPVAQTNPIQTDSDARAGGHSSLRAEKMREQTPPGAEVFLSREQAINELLDIHAEEEARRQKCLARYRVAVLTLFPFALLLSGIGAYFLSFPLRSVPKESVGILNMAAFALMTAVNILAQWYLTGWKRYTPLPNSFCALLSDVKEEDFTPLFSSPLQQNVITAMLFYSDEPRIADALCRALVYYRKDRNLLYVRLARLLPLLPNDGSALSEFAQRALLQTKNRTVESSTNHKEQTLPVLQAAAKAYFARTGEPAPRPKRKWFPRGHGAQQKQTKETI